MKKNRLKLCFFIFFLFIICLCGSHNKTYALEVSSDIETQNVGLYAVTKQVWTKEKVYFSPALQSFIISTGREVNKQWTLFGYKYYYYADKFVDKIVEIKTITNDFESVVFMINELENKAIEKITNDENYKSFSSKKLVLGYLRSINRNYYDGYGNKWSLIAGECNENFIKEVNEDFSHGLRFNEFFSQFVTYNDYNKELHGKLEQKFQRNGKDVLYLQDPYDGKSKIDLIHLFASIDGIYTLSVAKMISEGNVLNDLVSWAGDLQSTCKVLNDIEKDMNREIEFKDFSFEWILYDIPYKYKNKEGNDKVINSFGSSIYDINSDIDAMNIAKGFLEYNESLSNSISFYYQLEAEYRKNRYMMFLRTITIDIDNNNGNVGNAYTDFENEVCYYLNVKIDDEGNYINSDNFDLKSKYISIMTNQSEMPSLNVRKFMAKEFIKYVSTKLDIMVC